MKINKSTISICIPIEITDYLKSFIFKNINYARNYYNKMVEIANNCKGEDCLYNDFHPLKYRTEYFKQEKKNNIYEKYCVGICDQEAAFIDKTLNHIRKKNFRVNKYNETHETKLKYHSLHFRRFDRFFGSFKVRTKSTITSGDNISNRIKVKDKNILEFRVRDKGYINKERINIYLKEPLFDYVMGKKKHNCRYFVKEYSVIGEDSIKCIFDEYDIKEVCFIHKLRKFYIQLTMTVRYYINISDIKSRKLKAGIDTGIHNPGMLYDDDRDIMHESVCIRLPQNVANKLHYLERKARRLQHIKDKKYLINKIKIKYGKLKDSKGNLLTDPRTKNYWKVMYKFRKIWNKIVNIRRQWIYTTCKKIVTKYQMICVDTFKQPENRHLLNNKLKHIMNYTNRFHSMYLFNSKLKYMSVKYGCEYIEAPPDTTRTCSNCGHINEHLPLAERYLVCAKCGTVIDRDINASKNCYYFI